MRKLAQLADRLCRSRRAVITAEVAELAAEYQARHGHPPNTRALFAMAQFVTLLGIGWAMAIAH